MVLDEEQITRQRQPITTPATPQPPQTTPPLPSWADRHEPLPGYAAEPNAGPGGTSTPAEPALTWQGLLIERNRAEQERLRNAAIADARLLDPTFNPAGYQAHHIVPLNEYPELSGLRARLEEWGIDLNDASVNGVMLPARPGLGKETLHSDTQRNFEYEQAIRERFERVQTREQAIAELAQIRVDLRNGTFIPPNKG